MENLSCLVNSPGLPDRKDQRPKKKKAVRVKCNSTSMVSDQRPNYLPSCAHRSILTIHRSAVHRKLCQSGKTFNVAKEQNVTPLSFRFLLLGELESEVLLQCTNTTNQF